MSATDTAPTAITAAPMTSTSLDRRRPAVTVVLASLGVFMTALDTLVVTTALPVLRTHLHAGLSGLEWTVNAYNLTFACLLLTGAALGDRFGRRRIFCAGLTVFTFASVVAALSGSIEVLIAARALQGAGAAIVMPLSLTLICDAFPSEKRAVAIGMWGGIVGAAVAAGPLVGGAVVDGLSWQAMFWINVPVGVIVVPLARRRLVESHGPGGRLDLPGLVLAAGGMLAITWALVHASSAGWTTATVAGPLALGVVVLGGFVAWERRSAQPMVPPHLFRSATFTAANGVSFFMYASLFGALFLMSQLLQTALGYTPLQAGVRLLPWTLPPMVVSPLAGKLAERYGNRLPMVAGLALQAAGYSWIIASTHTHIGYLQLGLAFATAGVGTSLCFPTVAAAVMSSVPPADIGTASGTNSTFRELGGVVGVAVLSTVFNRPDVYNHPATFVDGFHDALWCAVALAAAGALAAVLTGRRGGAPSPVDVSRPGPNNPHAASPAATASST